jgi:hypothetical protein
MFDFSINSILLNNEQLAVAIQKISIVTFDQYEIALQVDFANPWEISQSIKESDTLVITIKHPEKFVDSLESQTIKDVQIVVLLPP